MADLDFAQYIEQERQRISKKMDDINSRRADLDEELNKLSNELRAIEAYEMVKEGKAPVLAMARKSGGVRRKGVREDVIKLVHTRPQGIGRAEILEQMQVKGDKAKEQSISNALANAKKKGELINKDGLYFYPTT